MTNELAIKENNLPAESGEMTPTSLEARERFTVQGELVKADQRRRNEDEARKALIQSCKRRGFAETALYTFPRGGKEITGASVNLAREAARLWGNIEHGFVIVREEENNRLIQAYAVDKQTNTRVIAEDAFKKLIQRKKGNGTEWIRPDERDLRELTNRRAAIIKRNCILEILPKDLIDEAQEAVRATLKKTVKQDPESVNKMINAFLSIGVKSEMIEKRIGHDVKKATPEELEELRGIYNSIRDGNSTVEEHFEVAAKAEGQDKPATSKSEELARQLKPEGKLE